jgi:hypothetical protein
MRRGQAVAGSERKHCLSPELHIRHGMDGPRGTGLIPFYGRDLRQVFLGYEFRLSRGQPEKPETRRCREYTLSILLDARLGSVAGLIISIGTSDAD